MYVCYRCWEDSCGSGHGKGEKNQGWSPIYYFLITSFLLGFILPSTVVGLIDIYYVSSWNDLETTDISELPDSGWVKLQGSLVGDYSDEIITGDEDTWKLESGAEFILNDSTGEILIGTSKYYKIERGPHIMDLVFGERSSYTAGDEVKVICEVSNENGNKSAILLWLGQKDDNPMIQFWSFFTFFIVIIPVTIGYLFLLGKGLKMRAKHMKKVEYRNPIDIRNTDLPKKQGFTWHKNPTISKKKIKKISAILLCILFLLLILSIIIFPLFFHTQYHYWGASLVWMFILPFMFFLPIVIIFDRGMIKPNEVAVSNNGVHFFYDDPIIRYLEDDFIGWDEIMDLKYDNPDRSVNWIIKKKDNTKYNLNKLNETNRILVGTGWLEWKEINQKHPHS
jgi:hypothetical protein